MTWPGADDVHRTAKGLLDSGRARSPEEARQILESLVLQVDVGPALGDDPTAQAALATVVNAGHRAFLGGVDVRLAADPPLSAGWMAGMSAAQAVIGWGGRVVDRLSSSRPTLVIAGGAPAATIPGRIVLYLTWRGWCAGVVGSSTKTIDGPGIALAGVAAASLAVSEAFQHSIGSVVAGRRDVGISLWRPGISWRDPAAAGEPLQWLPAALWLLGLGHLGQGYAWSLGLLPYASPDRVRLHLVDFDRVVRGNLATQLLATAADIDRQKTRVASIALERLGIRTVLVERAFDDNLYPQGDEPVIALAGFDRREPRLHLGGRRFERVVDVGLGAGPVEYLDLVLHTLPPWEPASAFPATQSANRAIAPAYEIHVAQEVGRGVEEGIARCGALQIAGLTVGAAFVGAFAGSLAVADVLRLLHGGQEFSVIGIDLRDPTGIQAVVNETPSGYCAPAYTDAA